MLIHTVFFWLKPELTEAERSEFRRGVESLAAIQHVHQVYVGTPAAVPDRPVVDIPDTDPIFHSIYDLDNRYQVPGAQYLRSGRTYEQDGISPHWRGIYDDRGRLLVAICHDMDLGDAWEYADWPEYDEKFSGLAFRIVSNYIVYAMTH